MAEPMAPGPMLEALPGGVVATDPGGLVSFLNQEARRLLALPVGGGTGLPASHLLPELDWQSALAGRACPGEQLVGSGRVRARLAPIQQGGRSVGAIALLWEVAGQAPTKVNRPSGADPFGALIGQSEPMRQLRHQAALAARSHSTVLLHGESGTGKELLARAIHSASGRREGPFISVNCAAIPEGLLESEFFGYAEGAFTGARKGGKPGKFEQASGGTLFLDEIGELALPLQAKLLRALQERAVERVGGLLPHPVDIRVIAASNRNLADMVAQGAFRGDLYYRLNVLMLHLPPLRERLEDLPLLVEHLLRKLGAADRTVTPALLDRLRDHPWPGNVRELENVLERAIALEPGPALGVEHLPDYLLRPSGGSGPWRQSRREFERKALLEALERSGGNKSRAARLLGLSRSRFYEKLGELC